MKGFDVWKLLGGRAPRGYKRGVLSGKAGLDAVKAGGKTKGTADSLGSSLSSSDLATLLAVAGVPLGTYGLAHHWTQKKRKEPKE